MALDDKIYTGAANISGVGSNTQLLHVDKEQIQQSMKFNPGEGKIRLPGHQV